MEEAYLPITDRKLFEIFSNASGGRAVYVSQKLVIQAANPAMLNYWNKDSTVQGQELLRIFPEFKETWLINQSYPEFMEDLWKSGNVSGFTNQPVLFQQNNLPEVCYFDICYQPLKNEEGYVYAILHTVIDVTERNILSLKLQNITEKGQQSIFNSVTDLASSEARFRQLIHQAPIAICVLIGEDHVIESANELILNIWGKTEDIRNLPLITALPELKDQIFIPLLDKVYSTGIAYQGYGEKVTMNCLGALCDYYMDFIYQPLKNGAGEVTSIMVVATDITSQKLKGYEYQKAVDLLDFSIKAAEIGTWSIDLQTGSYKFSQRHKELFGFLEGEDVSPDQLVNQISLEFRDHSSKTLQTCIEHGGFCDTTFSVIGYHDGILRWVRALGGVIRDEAGTLTYFSGVSIETTQQKQDELRKNQFISIVSHELKTPLTSMKGYIQLLKQKAEQSEDRFMSINLMKADNRIDKMTTIINSFLNVSQLESGKIQLIKEPFIIQDLIFEIVEEANIYGNGKRIKFMQTGSTSVSADRNKIEQVISNLLSNANKYSLAGSNIEIDCFADTESVTVKVKNYGPGIHPKDQSRIFERYFRVESLENKNISGFGIGLYLCKEILDQHQGNLWIESEPNEGSTFIFSLPINSKTSESSVHSILLTAITS